MHRMQQVRACGATVRRRRELHALRRLGSFWCIASPLQAKQLITLIRFEDPLRALMIALISNSRVQLDYVTTQLLYIVIRLRSPSGTIVVMFAMLRLRILNQLEMPNYQVSF